jgi:3-isopropylmalate dehydrogenase
MGAAMTRSVDKVLENPLTRTRDIGGPMGCRDFAACVEEAVARA